MNLKSQSCVVCEACGGSDDWEIIENWKKFTVQWEKYFTAKKFVDLLHLNSKHYEKCSVNKFLCEGRRWIH